MEMINRITLILFFLIVLGSCKRNQEIKQETIDSLHVYIKAKDLLIKNISGVNEVLEKKEKYVSWRTWNDYYFENTIIPDNPELKELKFLWKESYISSENGGTLTLTSDSVVIFVTFYESSFFSIISHCLIYSNDESSYLNSANENLILSYKIDKEWTYLILQSDIID